MRDEVYVVHFDHRADGGPEYVGPFAFRPTAQRWLEKCTFDYEAEVVTVARPS